MLFDLLHVWLSSLVVASGRLRRLCRCLWSIQTRLHVFPEIGSWRIAPTIYSSRFWKRLGFRSVLCYGTLRPLNRLIHYDFELQARHLTLLLAGYHFLKFVFGPSMPVLGYRCWFDPQNSLCSEHLVILCFFLRLFHGDWLVEVWRSDPSSFDHVVLRCKYPIVHSATTTDEYSLQTLTLSCHTLWEDVFHIAFASA